MRREQMHTWSKTDVQLTGLPAATEAQGRDRAWALDKLIWNAELTLFGLATIGLSLAAVDGSVGWVIAALAVMVGSYIFGRWFAIKVPHTHLADMRVPLAHGEVSWSTFQGTASGKSNSWSPVSIRKRMWAASDGPAPSSALDRYGRLPVIAIHIGENTHVYSHNHRSYDAA